MRTWSNPVEIEVVSPLLPTAVLAKRNELLAAADAHLRGGLIELAKRFPQLTKHKRWQTVGTQKSQDGVRVGLIYDDRAKLGPSTPVAEDDRYMVLVFVVPPPPQPGQLPLKPLYPNLQLVGNVTAYAGNAQLDAALKKLVMEALAPLEQFNEELARD